MGHYHGRQIGVHVWDVLKLLHCLTFNNNFTYNTIICVSIYNKMFNVLYFMCGYMAVNLSVLSEVFTALLTHVLISNAPYVNRCRNIPKIYHIVCFAMMGQGLNRLRTDT